MGIYSEAFYKHWILFPTVWHLPRFSQGRTQGKAKYDLKNAHSLTRTVKNQSLATDITLYLKNGWRQMGICFEAFDQHWILSIHVTFTAIVPGAYLWKAKMCKKCATRRMNGYRQRNVRQFLQSAWHIIWLPDESHAGMTLPSSCLLYTSPSPRD